ncbi:MAG: NADP-dependent oxidoreductase [Actinomycetota bacterium]|nr:NADP-dependent oxidoreductase [Actinomycetota bacterium]
MTYREWHLTRRPEGVPVDDDFALVEGTLPDLEDGQVLVENTFLSVDPYMRGRMNDAKSYVPAFRLDAAMDGGAVGVVRTLDGDVVDSEGRAVKVGDTVLHGLGWRTHAVLPGKALRVVDTDVAPAQAWLGVLGMTGLTAYAGLLRVAELKEGDAVFVSAAAGSVGSLVGQIARLKGASLVVGSAGGPDKARWLLDDLGFDRAVDYKAGPIGAGLREAAPDGIDVYFDNVGGDHLEAALTSLKPHGRAAICGMIQRYNDTGSVPGPRNLALVIGKRLTLAGFIVSDHQDLRAQFEQEVGTWVREGKVMWRETVVEGVEEAVHGFQSLLSGGNTGKMLVRL